MSSKPATPPVHKSASRASPASDWVHTGYLVLPQQGKPARNAKLPVPAGVRSRIVTQPW